MKAARTQNGESVGTQLKAAQAQLQMYARDFGKLLERERDKTFQVEAANRQLQVYAHDLKSSFLSEQRRSAELEKAHHDSLMRLLRASRFKDNETGSHLRRVKQLSLLMATYMEWSEGQAALLADSSPMHDVGKIGVPDVILHKPASLSEEEWKTMRRHTTFGALLLQGSSSPLLEMAREVALCHHERWDGTGYPQGLKESAIPLPARLVAIIDVYDALRTQRPYKPPFSHAKACDVICNGDGRTAPGHFDPDVLRAFRDLQPKFEAVHARLYH
jgi:putative two-component system response regulator